MRINIQEISFPLDAVTIERTNLIVMVKALINQQAYAFYSFPTEEQAEKVFNNIMEDIFNGVAIINVNEIAENVMGGK